MCVVDHIELFAPDDTGVANGNYFGFPFTLSDSALVLMSVPWDATVSYGAGTALGPQAIIDASIQVEIYDPHYPDAWRKGIATLPPLDYAATHNGDTRAQAARIISDIENAGTELAAHEAAELLAEVNHSCAEMTEAVYAQAHTMLESGKIVGLVGGDHSTPLGLIQALSDHYTTLGQGFGILHIDAHADLRDAYEGFEQSHASIMRNSIKTKGITALTQVGIRDYSCGEADYAHSEPRIVQFTDNDLKNNMFNGVTWHNQCLNIIDTLPENVYISFDIDGLSPLYCPGTGTPVPGGLLFAEATHLLKTLHESGRSIIGFDLTEVSPTEHNEWDANVGARVLYKLCGLSLSTTTL